MHTKMRPKKKKEGKEMNEKSETLFLKTEKSPPLSNSKIPSKSEKKRDNSIENSLS